MIVEPCQPRWVDFHSHLDLYADHADLITECDRERVATLAVTTTPRAWQRNRELAAGSSYVRVALGLHPQLVAERANELPLLESLLENARYVGEVGLDAGRRFYGSFPAQERVFGRILRACAEQGGKILTIHSVRAAAKVLAHVERSLPPDRGRVVLHWFTGTTADSRRAVALGCYFSINLEMLNAPKHRELIRALPADRLLTETDGPFIQVAGRPARPRDVVATIERLAAVRSVTVQSMATTVLENLKTLLTPS